MITTAVRDILHKSDEYIGKDVRLCGWVRTVRDVKACAFIELNDGSVVKNIQLVADGASDLYAPACALTVGSAVIVTGKVNPSPNPHQPIEVALSSLTLEGDCPTDYPLQKKRHSIEYLRTLQHLRPRTNLFNSAFRIRSEAAYAIHSFFHSRGFVYAHTPIITASDAEGAGAMFRATTLDLCDVPKNDDGTVDYSKDFFGKSAYLTVSGQLEAETFALAFGKTYTFGPTFRAERSNTTRHAAEFWMIEPEIAFAELPDVMTLAEDMVKYIIDHVMKTCPDELEFLNSFVDKDLLNRLNAAKDSSFGKVTYTEAVEILKSSGAKFEFPVFWGCDLQTEHEKYLTEIVYKKPVFVTDYPKEIKAFYMRLNDDGKTVAACDMLVPGIGELIGGSQREERLDVLTEKLRELSMDKELYWWYLELRKFGGTHHGGFGLGFERMIMYLTGISNIRDVLPFPRTVGTAEF